MNPRSAQMLESISPASWRYPSILVIASIIVVELAAVPLAGCSGSAPTTWLGPYQSGQVCPVSALPPPPTPPTTCPVSTTIVSNDMPQNGLDAASLKINGALLAGLRDSKLSPSIFSNDLFLQDLLTKPHAADLVKYVASCALDPCDVLLVPPPPATGPLTAGQLALKAVRDRYPNGFRGELGLCGLQYRAATGDTTSTLWKAAAADTDEGCLQRVSACVLARVNQIGKRVPLSLRGKGMTLASRVPVQTTFRENHGTPIRSFQPCDEACLWGDPLARNCDWQPGHVGQCVTNTTVSFTLPLNERARVRICQGLQGCDDHVTVGAGPTTFPTPPDYGGEMLGQGANQVQFICPDNGPRVGTNQTGYFAVMVGPPPVSALTSPEVAATDLPPQSGIYPASESQVFTFREGAFYGQLFKLTPYRGAAPCDGTAFGGDQYVCYSNTWSAGVAMAADRFCAGPDSACFANAPANCDLMPHPTLPNQSVLGVGTPVSLSVGAKVYDSCKVGTTAWNYPYTTYLNHPCDLFPSVAACLPYLNSETSQLL